MSPATSKLESLPLEIRELILTFSCDRTSCLHAALAGRCLYLPLKLRRDFISHQVLLNETNNDFFQYALVIARAKLDMARLSRPQFGNQVGGWLNDEHSKYWKKDFTGMELIEAARVQRTMMNFEKEFSNRWASLHIIRGFIKVIRILYRLGPSPHWQIQRPSLLRM